MSKRLHIIAACSNRKCRSAEVSLGDVSGSSAKVRARRWWRSLTDLTLRTEFGPLVQAQQLYTGNYWSIVRQIPQEVRKQTLRPSLWVISAGYGLVSGDDRLLPYSATFARGQVDSVHNGILDKSRSAEWWRELTRFELPDSNAPRTLSRLMADSRSDRFLVIASSDYVSAIESDLILGHAALRNPDNLVLISTRTNSLDERLRSNLVPTDAKMLCDPRCGRNCDFHLLGKGVRGSIGASLARYFVSNLQTWGFSAAQFASHIEAALEGLPIATVPKRTSMTDTEIKRFIRTAKASDKRASATRLLGMLRESGKACEQKRFKRLYSEAYRTKE